MSLCFPGIQFDIDRSNWYAKFSNGSEIWFGGLDDKERTEKVLGNEYSTIYFNECSQLTNYDTIVTGLTRLAENTKLSRIAFFDENPPSKRHWSYKVFIDGVLPTGERISNHERYYHLRLNPDDNTDNLPGEYIEETLMQLPKRQRKRFLLGEFGDDSEGALWTADIIKYSDTEEFSRIVVAVDPAVTAEEDSDETGIVVVGEDTLGGFHVLEDYSGTYTPREMARVVIGAYNRHQADRIIGEVNNGGDFIEAVIRNEDPNLPFTAVRATRGKVVRAEPVVALYEQNRVKHIKELKELEDQMCTWAAKKGEKSPDRVDALVWAVTYLMNDEINDLIYA